MATISNLSVRLTANISGFASGMAKAVTPLKELGGHVASVGSKIAGLTSLVTGGGLLVLVHHAMESIDATAKLSDRLGIATEKLGGLQHGARLAGVSSDELTGGLEKMLKAIGEAVTGGGEAGATFAKLGLDAQKLADATPDEAFTQIAEGLKNITNPAERATAAMAIFGKSGQSLLPLLMSGREGIAAAQEEAEKLGITFNRVDAAKVEAANDAMTKVGETITGLGQTLAIQLAPFIEAAANKLTAFASSGEGAGAKVTNGFNAVLSTVAELADFLSVVEAGWQMLRSGASYAIGGIVDGIGYVLDALSWLAQKLGLVEKGFGDYAHTLAKGFYDTGKEAFQKAGEDWDAFQNRVNSKAAARAIADIQAASEKNAQAIADNAAKLNGGAASAEDFAKKLQKAAEDAKKVTETLADLQKEVETFGMSAGEKKIFDLKALGADPAQLEQAQRYVDQLKNLEDVKKATDLITETQKAIEQFSMTDSQKKLADIQLPGVNPEQLEQARKALEQLDALNEQKKKMEEGQQVFEQTRNPLEKYEAQITKLSDLLESGAINWETYSRAVSQAREQLEQANKTSPPELFRAGTAQAQKYVYDLSRGQQKLSPDEIARKAYAEQQEQTRIQRRMEIALNKADDLVTQTVNI